MKSHSYTQTTPVCTQDSLNDCVADSIMDGLPVSAADEELVLRAVEIRQMVARYEVLAKKREAGSWRGPEQAVTAFRLMNKVEFKLNTVEPILRCCY